MVCVMGVGGDVWLQRATYGRSSLQKLTIFRARRRRFSLHPLEGQTALAIDGVDLFHKLPLDTHEIAFAKPAQFLVHLIFHPPQTFLGAIVIVPPAAPRTK